jgi:hypothetical protein
MFIILQKKKKNIRMYNIQIYKQNFVKQTDQL